MAGASVAAGSTRGGDAVDTADDEEDELQPNVEGDEEAAGEGRHVGESAAGEGGAPPGERASSQPAREERRRGRVRHWAPGR
jgi:hypothetical protein